MTVKITWDDPAIAAFLTDRSYVSASRAATRLRDDARARAPHKTGAGAASINTTLVDSGSGGTTYTVGPELEYMVYQENGTGPITARAGGALRFAVGGVFIFRKSTRGVPAAHFMRNALLAMTSEDFNSGA